MTTDDDEYDKRRRRRRAATDGQYGDDGDDDGDGDGDDDDNGDDDDDDNDDDDDDGDDDGYDGAFWMAPKYPGTMHPNLQRLIQAMFGLLHHLAHALHSLCAFLALFLFSLSLGIQL